MDLLEGILTRRSIGKVKPNPIPQETIEQLLDAAICAPNHHRTEPWRFFVMTGEGRRPLGRVLAEIVRESLTDPESEASQKRLHLQAQKPYRAPVVIAIAVTPADNAEVVTIEEIAAVSAAVQNLLLAAHAKGLGAMWRSGLPTYHPKMKQLFDLQEKDYMLGFVYIGYPDMQPAKRRRTPFQQKTIWLDTDQWS